MYAAEGGDDDDFEYMLGDMPDYRPAEGSGQEGDAIDLPVSPVEGGEPATDLEARPAENEEVQEGGQPPKKKRRRQKKGPKASSLEFEASRQLAAEIADSPATEQADWLWHSFQQCMGASSLEREGLTADCLVEVPHDGSLEDRLKALAPQDWRRLFCGEGGSSGSRSGPGGGARKGGSRDAKGGSGGGGGGGGSDAGGGAGSEGAGAPALLLVSPAAMGAIKLMKHCPGFHKACRIAKLFAKHIKVPEQQELLASTAVCVGAGTPNRITKLADLEALKLHNLAFVVLDTSLDAKQRTILDIPETRNDWWELFSKHLRPLVAAGKTRLALVNSDKLETSSMGGR
ncbi:hypothetical protein N2152v2_010392 [Parachlorella kessleri]